MAAPSVVTGTVEAKVYATVADAAYTTPTNLTKTKTAVTTQVKNCTSFGPITKSGNPVEFTPFGESTTKTVAGAASLGELSFTCTILESDTLHAALLGATVGKFIQVMCLKASGSNEAAYYARGTISGSEQTFDTPNELTITIALAEAPVRRV